MGALGNFIKKVRQASGNGREVEAAFNTVMHRAGVMLHERSDTAKVRRAIIKYASDFELKLLHNYLK